MSPQFYKELFLMYYNPLCNFAFGIVRDETRVEDIVQDVFLQLWRKRDELDEKNNIKGYLFTSTKNKALEELRRNKIMLKSAQKLENTEITSEAESESEEWNDWIKIDQIYSSLRHLPPKCREVFEMAKINGLTYAQIATKLQISPKTVENHMAKAFLILRGRLSNFT